MATAFLSLGSNVGEKLENLTKAVHLLAETPGITLQKISSVYQTDPVGYEEQDIFLNIAIQIETHLKPEALLHACLQVEEKLGRVRLFKWGPRLIDVDVLLYDDIQMDTEKLKIPHPFMQERAFVMLPLLEIAEEVAKPYFIEKQIENQGIKRTNFQIKW
ncbi:2-amino-4-hydroxy-6-hydroxymethyldihydropteridine diphosphokinase [Listeria fleischmannii]|uniref:2-amino-4-hydroxy-6-hydroxymethyldihydropteridine diphosphokinase n=1 Tax=Listeria fleischmannii FSL S10-1203 TaxID=1265822 RepID=W7DM10_9LIST|nr:2-amino-4-hydroxy-6-hydroxymethyldihydropteridine diphosphokinase [Listeria fleischmannii]EUJ48828.1 2-amino-4-hydroxy-6-hydroxymethyldihydropteridine pyrophosphokinase [Listeria fleischmannii FSL S10-1203]